MLNSSQLEKLMKAANKAGWQMKPAGEVKEKILNGALGSYANGAARQDVYAVYDTTVFGSGKSGFLLTADALYNDSFATAHKREGTTSRLPLAGIQSVKAVAGDKYDYTVTYQDGSRIVIYTYSGHREGLLALLRAAARAEKAAPAPAQFDLAREEAETKAALDELEGTLNRPEKKLRPLDTGEGKAEEKPAPKPTPAPKPKKAETPKPAPAPEAGKTMDAKAEALFQQGKEAYEAGNYTKALPLMERAAERGHIDAQFYCAAMYTNHEGISEKKAEEPKNQAKAQKWFENAAREGNIVAQLHCGLFYAQGRGVPQNWGRAFHWIKISADNGYVKAMPHCGNLYEKGLGTERNARKAIAWYSRAKEAGDDVGAKAMARWEKAKALASGDTAAAETYFLNSETWDTLTMEDGRNAFFAGEYAKAFPLLSYAAQAGAQDARFLLGRMYAQGLGIARDSRKARELLNSLEKRPSGKRYTLSFGTYPQGENGEAAPISWLVLDRRGDRLLLISEKILAAKRYHNQNRSVQWASCDLRKWMNGEFLEKAFSPADVPLIHRTVLTNPDSTPYQTPGGGNTEDRIFALSVPEAVAYFCKEGEKPWQMMNYQGYRVYDSDIRARAVWNLPVKGFPDWWLRTPGMEDTLAAMVTCWRREENIQMAGTAVYKDEVGARMALWLDLGQLA